MSKSLHTYKGNCHCGANRYEIQLPDLPALVVCGCTLCAKKGYIWIYDVDIRLKITRGCTVETLTTYTASHTKGLKHQFCSTCGTGLFGTHASGARAGKKGINFRVLISDAKGIFIKGRDMIALDSSGGIEPYAGSLCSVENASTAQPTKFLGTLPDVTGDDLKFYTGGCDCGVVQIAVGTKSLYDADIKEDNCSICIRNSFIGFYPHKSQVTLVGNDQTQDYKFGREFNGSPFCRICGVHCFGNLYGPPKEILDRLSEARREFVRKQLEVQPLNIRVLDDVEWDRINITWSNDGTEGYILPE